LKKIHPKFDWSWVTCTKIVKSEEKLKVQFLFIYCFTSRSIIFLVYGDVSITGEGLQNLGLCSRRLSLWAERDLYHVTPVWHGVLVFPVSSKGLPPFNRLLRIAKGCWGSILAQILTGPCPREDPG
jgi:hypothetical protein